MHPKKFSKQSQIAWSVYDIGHSGFGAVIITFVYSVFFTKKVVGDEVLGASLWSYAIGASGLIIAFLAPFIGNIADSNDGAKRGALGFTLLCMVTTLLLFFVPASAPVYWVVIALCLLVVSNVGYELALVNVNAMLPLIAPQRLWGRLSGIAWGAGYIGGLTILSLCLFLLVGIGDVEPLISLDTEDATNIRACTLLVVLWMAIFTLPMAFGIKFGPHKKKEARSSLVSEFHATWENIKSLKGNNNLILFLLGSMLYRDGLITLFAVGGIFAADVYEMSFTDVLIFAIGLNLFAGIGAAVLSYFDDKVGSRLTILMSLMGLMLIGMAILFVESKTVFIYLSLGLGLFVGPAQAAGRTFVSRLAPENMTGQIYGLYALTGKSIAFLGPLLYGLLTTVFETQRAGLSVILVLWLAGFIMIFFVKEQKVKRADVV